ncbi:MAG: preprotein translocase subunit SecG, partial [Sinomicrobium sp.]|nr:preprotein translocase subunit SecG [Sinomicrobium sp.]
QNPKGGGLSSSFGGGGTQMLGGVKETGNFLDKSTWALATILIVLILISNMTLTSGKDAADSKLLEGEDIETVIPDSNSLDNAPATSKDSTQK